MSLMTIAIDQERDPKKRGNAMIGERVHTLMWRSGRTQRELGTILQLDQGAISNRLRGKTFWSAVELAAVAAWLDVSVTDLLPEVEVDPPPPLGSGGPVSDKKRTPPIMGLRIIRPQPIPQPSDARAA